MSGLLCREYGGGVVRVKLVYCIFAPVWGRVYGGKGGDGQEGTPGFYTAPPSRSPIERIRWGVIGPH